jgi:hypothetical protein
MSWRRASRSPLQPDPDQGLPISDFGPTARPYAAGDEAAGDDLRLDLGGALEDAEDADIAETAADDPERTST